MHVIITLSIIFYNYKFSMKYLISCKRSRTLVGIGIVAISIGLISKKVSNYPDRGCVKGTQELNLNF